MGLLITDKKVRKQTNNQTKIIVYYMNDKDVKTIAIPLSVIDVI